MRKLTLAGFAILLLIGTARAQQYAISTIAGNGTPGFSGDGAGAANAQLYSPVGVAVDGAGNVYIDDFANRRIRKVTPGGIISTVAGNGTLAYSGGDGGLATNSGLGNPQGVAVDSAGNIYIADTLGSRIRKVSAAGIISEVAGCALNSSCTYLLGDGGPAISATLYDPWGVAPDAAGNLYIADTGINRIRKVTPGGIISTVAGNGMSGFSGDGGLATNAEVDDPTAVAVDFVGNVYLIDPIYVRVRRVTPAGIISTVAGNGTQGFFGDGGQATNAELYLPSGVAVDSAGNIYIADSTRPARALERS